MHLSKTYTNSDHILFTIKVIDYQAYVYIYITLGIERDGYWLRGM